MGTLKNLKLSPEEIYLLKVWKANYQRDKAVGYASPFWIGPNHPDNWKWDSSIKLINKLIRSSQ